LLDQGRGIDCTALGIAAWIYDCTQPRPDGSTRVIDDPLSPTFTGLAERFEGAALVDAFLDLDEVFPGALRERADFRVSVQRCYRALIDEGMRSILRTFATHN
jgi:fructuronate reductase